MVTYSWQHPAWPHWRHDLTRLATPLAQVRHAQGRLLGRAESLGFKLRHEAWLETLTQDVLKSSEIENELMNRDQVRSSIARRLGLDIGALAPLDRHVEGVVEMMLDATQHYASPLTAARLCAWHGALFPAGRSGLVAIRVAAWRDDAHGADASRLRPHGSGKGALHRTARGAAGIRNSPMTWTPSSRPDWRICGW